jgi:hypothetical protein
VIKGPFVNNYPHGECTINYKDGGKFTGCLNRGVPEGQGVLAKDGFIYTGNFVEGLKVGDGILTI